MPGIHSMNTALRIPSPRLEADRNSTRFNLAATNPAIDQSMINQLLAGD
jgi:hypothetical protein